MDRRRWIGGITAGFLSWKAPLGHSFVSEDSEAIDDSASDGKTESLQADVPWLLEVTTPPSQLPPPSAWPTALLEEDASHGNAREKQKAVADWESKRKTIQSWWLQFLGLNPSAPRPRVQYKVLQEHWIEDAILRQLIRYTAHPGWEVEAYLLRPKKSDDLGRAAIVFHPTVENSIEEPAGIAGDGSIEDSPRALGLHLARRGFVTLSPRNYLWPTNHGIAAQEQADRWHRFASDQFTKAENSPSKTAPENSLMIGMGKMVYDGLIGVDILENIPEVNKERISAIGHSLGAKEAMYAAALDDRIRCAAASEGGIGIQFSNWEAPWYLGQEVHKEGLLHDHHELLALAAPKSILIVAGESADGDRGWPILMRAQSIYQALNLKVRLGQFNHRQGHPLNAEGARRMLDWLSCYG